MGQPVGRTKLYPDLAPVAILGFVAWTIAEHVLVAQFDSDLGCDVGQFIKVVNFKHTAAGYVADIGQHGGAGGFFLLGSAGGEEAKGKKVDISVFYQALCFTLCARARCLALRRSS